MAAQRGSIKRDAQNNRPRLAAAHQRSAQLRETRGGAAQRNAATRQFAPQLVAFGGGGHEYSQLCVEHGHQSSLCNAHATEVADISRRICVFSVPTPLRGEAPIAIIAAASHARRSPAARNLAAMAAEPVRWPKHATSVASLRQTRWSLRIELPEPRKNMRIRSRR